MEIETDISSVTSSEAVRIFNEEREARARELGLPTTADEAISAPLLSLTEAANTCQGWEDQEAEIRCGDEVPKGTELCRGCERQEQRRLNLEAWARDKEEEALSLSQYQHLRYER